jgi:uncharacterized paraquat-inducible protein A
VRGRRLRDLSPRDIDRMREVSDAAALDRHLAEQERLEAEQEACEENAVVCDACRSGEIDREEGRCGVCGSSVRWDLEVLVDCLAPPSEG